MKLFVAFSFALLLLVPASATNQEDELTKYIVNTVRDFGIKSFPESLLVSPVIKKTSSVARLEGDTLHIPEQSWGFKGAGDYRLHMHAGLLLYQDAYMRSMCTGNMDYDFFASSGKALNLVLEFIRKQEKSDKLLEPLLIRKIILEHYVSSMGSVVPSRDMNDPQLRFFSVLRAAIGYRCDTTLISEWMNTSKLASIGILDVVQNPEKRFGSKYVATIQLTNRGELECPVELYLDLSGQRDTLVSIEGFTGSIEKKLIIGSSLLKVVLDPASRIMEDDVTDNQFVSDEFSRKRKVFSMFVMVVWNIFSGFSAFVVMFLGGVFFHGLSNIYLKKHIAWTLIWFSVFAVIKLSTTSIFFGFNLWGFFHFVQYVHNHVGSSWLFFSAVIAVALTYYVSLKEQIVFTRYSAFLKWVVLLSFFEPLLAGLPLFINLW